MKTWIVNNHIVRNAMLVAVAPVAIAAAGLMCSQGSAAAAGCDAACSAATQVPQTQVIDANGKPKHPPVHEQVSLSFSHVSFEYQSQ